MKTISIDDTWYHIEIVDDCEEFKILHNFEFRECMLILLTERQHEIHIGRGVLDYKVSDKRIEEFKDYINDDNPNNIWRVQNKHRL